MHVKADPAWLDCYQISDRKIISYVFHLFPCDRKASFMEIICCNQFDPALGHNRISASSSSQGGGAAALKEAGKKLKQDTDISQLKDAVNHILSIFENKASFCPVSIGARRVCILFINWLHIIPLKEDDRFLKLGTLLLGHIGRSSPRLASVFFSEVFEMVRVIHDTKLVGGVSQVIEIFPRFVSATRRTLSDEADEQNRSRGICISIQSETASSAVFNLISLVSVVNEKFNGVLLTEQISVKLALALLALKADDADRFASKKLEEMARHVPAHWIDCHFDLWLQLRGQEEGEDDGEETQDVVSDSHEEISLSNLFKIPVFGHAAANGGKVLSVESVLSTLDEAHVGKVLPLLQRRLECGNNMEIGIFKTMMYYNHHLPFFKLFTLPSSVTPMVIGLTIGQACFKQDMPVLQSLSSSSVPELVVSHLHVPVLMHILAILKGNHNREGMLFLTGKLFDNKYTFSQLVDACGSDALIFFLAQLVGTESDSDFKEAFSESKKVAEYIAASTSAPPSTNSKRVKGSSSSVMMINNENINSGGFLSENYLHFIQLLEDSQFIQDKAVVIAILMSVVGEEVVKRYAIRTCEAIQCCTGNVFARKKVWTKFAKYIVGNEKILLQLIPVVVENLEAVDAPREFIDSIISRTAVCEGLKHLLSPSPGGREGLIETLEIELKADRTVSGKSALIRFGLRKIKKIENVNPNCLVIPLILDLVGSNLDNEALVSSATRFIAKFGIFLIRGGRPQICKDTSQMTTSTRTIAVKIIQQFLIPKLKLDSHAFAVQEIISVMGAHSFLMNSADLPAFSNEAKGVLAPYLSSSYRSTGDIEESGKIESLAELYLFATSHLPNGNTLRSIFSAMKLAIMKDSALCCWALPYVIETLIVVTQIEVVESIAKAMIHLIASDFKTSLEKKMNIKTVFGILDHLQTAFATTTPKRRSDETFSESYRNLVSLIPLDVLVAASVSVEDFPRALLYMERLLLRVPVTERTESHVIQLASTYKNLNMESGILGACTLLPKNIFSRSVEDLKFRDIISERLDSSYVLEKEKEEKLRFISLMESSKYRSALQCGAQLLQAEENDDWLRDKMAEACWKLGDWSFLTTFEENICHKTSSVSSFNRVFVQQLEAGSKVAETEKAQIELVKKIGLNFNYTDLTNIWLLEFEKEELRTEIEPKCMERALEGLVARERSDEMRMRRLRHLRKTRNFSHIKQILHAYRPVDMQHHCEWAKCAWVVGEKNLARDSLIQAMAVNGISFWKAELLVLKWSAELELLIPKVVVSNYRDLLSRSSQRDKASIAYSFGEYLDRVGSSSLFASEQLIVEVWNKNLLVKEIFSQYLDAIEFDTSGKRILFTLNRIFQLHWELLHSGDPGQVKLAQSVVGILSSGWKRTPLWVWFIALPQLLVRVVTTTSEISLLCEEIIVAVFAEFPRQASWVIMPALLNSKKQERREIAAKIIFKANQQSNYPNFSQLISVMRLVGESLVAVARYDPVNPSSPSSSMRALSETKEGAKLLRNTGGLLVLPNKDQISSSAVLASIRKKEGSPFGTEVRIAKFLDQVHVYDTKAKPKRISLLDSEGKHYQYILKLEKKTDLRKDSRMMDFVNVVNSELAKQSSDQLKTYSVLTLSEDSALIEFVPNLITMRKIIDESLALQGKSVSLFLNKEVMTKLQNKSEGFTFFKSIVDTIPPMIADWLAREFLSSGPKRWLEARIAFTISQALWSMVGHIVGLGDRHPDNILIETRTGEIMHVDFDCIFSGGMTLTIPELVPFRLSRICVSAMGVIGVEGLFRSKCEQTLTLLRDKKKPFFLFYMPSSPTLSLIGKAEPLLKKPRMS